MRRSNFNKIYQYILSKSDIFLRIYQFCIKRYTLVFLIAVILLITWQLLILVISNFAKKSINEYLEFYKNTHNLEYSKLVNKSSLFGINIKLIKVSTEYKDIKIFAEELGLSCNLISCLYGKIAIKPNDAVEIKFKNNEVGKNLMISFTRDPKIVIKRKSDELYLFLNLYKYKIMDIQSLEEVSTIDKHQLIFNEVKRDGFTDFIVSGAFESKDIFNLNKFLAKNTSFLFNSGDLKLNFNVNGWFSNANADIFNKYNIKNIQFSLKTSEFKIESSGGLKSGDKDCGIVLNIYNYYRFIDYISTVMANIFENDIRLVKIFHKTMTNKGIQGLTFKNDNTNVELLVEKKQGNKIYINNIPIGNVLFNFLSAT